MPREVFDNNWEFLKRNELLTYEEILLVIDSFVKLGLKKVRLTGGEPLIRKDMYELIRIIKNKYPNLEIALTTNGSLLSQHSQKLKQAGLDRITISLDSLEPKLFEKMSDTKIPITRVLDGIQSVCDLNFKNIKINCVIKKGLNENQIIPLIEYFKNKNVILRFIEYMDVGNSNQWNMDQVFTKEDIIKKINSKYEFSLIGREKKSDVAEQWIEKNTNQKIEVISSISQPFCSNCTRARLSSDGKLYTCLFAFNGFDIKKILRENGDITTKIKEVWEQRDDQFSELRNEFITSQKKVEMSYIGG